MKHSGAGRFFSGLIDDVRILRLRSGQVLRPCSDAVVHAFWKKKLNGWQSEALSAFFVGSVIGS